MVRAHIVPRLDDTTTYPRLDDGSYIAVQLGNIDSGPAWTDIDR